MESIDNIGLVWLVAIISLDILFMLFNLFDKITLIHLEGALMHKPMLIPKTVYCETLQLFLIAI